MMEWKEWIGKNIFVQLKSGTVYSGVINSVDEVFMYITDKYDFDVVFAISDIVRIKEESK